MVDAKFLRPDTLALHAGATRVREGEFTFTHADLLQVLTAFNAMK